MNILIAGGSGVFINNLIIKLNKEGHKVSILTGNRFASKDDYHKCFEVYQFPYDAACLNEIFESAAPEVTIFMGAFDTNFKWKNVEADSVKYTASLANILMGYLMHGKGRFIYLSNESVFSDNNPENFTEDDIVTPDGFRAQAIAQGESQCDSYRISRGMDIVTLRLDHIVSVPLVNKDICEICGEMCLQAMADDEIEMNKKSTISLLYDKDAVEGIYSLITCPDHKYDIYQLSSGNVINEADLAEIVRDRMNPECSIVDMNVEKEKRIVLSGKRFESEFGNPRFDSPENIVEKITKEMKKKPYVFLTDEDEKISIWARIRQKGGWFFRAIIPFIENIIIFIPCFLLYDKTANSNYFANLDLYLLYVLLFAMVFGQQQATVSALLAVIGYFITNMGLRSGFEILLDGNTYVWIAQLFIVGLSVGYMRDQIVKLKKESREENEYLSQQIEDINDINSTNARVKDVLETQLVNQSDSIGKIYSITSELEQYSPEEVLFYAAETVGKIMKTRDVAIYQVSNGDYARLFSSTSPKARMLGNSVKYTDMDEFYTTIANNKVFINRRMDARYPLMGNAIFEEGEMKIIIMVWGLTWENMTLGQANQLSVVSMLIQNAVLRANRYLDVLQDKRYVAGTRALAPESFEGLVNAFLKAKSSDLNECTLIKFNVANNETGILAAQGGLRTSDYLGTYRNSVFALLSNTNTEAAGKVIGRFEEKGLISQIVEGLE